MSEKLSYESASEDQELLITRKKEERNLEYKGDLSFKKKYTRALLMRAMIAMANLRNGGQVIFGIKDRSFKPIGVSPKVGLSLSHDDISSTIQDYVDPFIDFAVDHVEYDGGKYVIVSVKEFLDTPVICKKNYPCKWRDRDIGLRQGDIYIRPRGRRESRSIRTYSEMRDLLETALEKELIKQRRRSALLGEKPKKVKRKDTKRFEEELEDVR